MKTFQLKFFLTFILWFLAFIPLIQGQTILKDSSLVHDTLNQEEKENFLKTIFQYSKSFPKELVGIPTKLIYIIKQSGQDTLYEDTLVQEGKKGFLKDMINYTISIPKEMLQYTKSVPEKLTKGKMQEDSLISEKDTLTQKPKESFLEVIRIKKREEIEAKKIITDAYTKAEKILNQAHEGANKILNQAATESRNKALKIINDAVLQLAEKKNPLDLELPTIEENDNYSSDKKEFNKKQNEIQKAKDLLVLERLKAKTRADRLLIHAKEAEINTSEKLLLMAEIQRQEQIVEIENGKKQIELQASKMKNQRTLQFALIGSIIMLLLLAVVIYSRYLLKQKANARLKAQNEKIIIQKEELAKLSIVAEETDSGVIIADSDGKLEWINKGLIRMTGYTFEEFKNVLGSTIAEISSNPDIVQVQEDIIKNKMSVSYESSHINKTGEKIWTSSTLTPVFGNDEKLKKIVMVYNNITELKKAEESIRQKNKDITDSINYASKIQIALLPLKEDRERLLPQSFVLYKPKDIVSGDFFWITEKNNRVYFVTADCTGHGVPGAFMSMICTSLLNDVIKDKGFIKPGEILNKVREGIIDSLKQKGEIGEQKDGMDIALCSLEYTNDTKFKLQYAGAYNPVYILRNNPKFEIRNPKFEIQNSKFNIDEMEPAMENNGIRLYEIKADRQPVGYYLEKLMPFTNHTIQLIEGDMIYIFSDGYADQFGGPKNKKFSYKRFKKLLLNIQHLSMKKQQERLQKAFQDWKGNEEQLDDVLVIGVKV